MVLPISLVAIDNVAHSLTRLALVESLSKIQPVQVLILTDDPKKIPVPGADYAYFNGDYFDAQRALWHVVPPLLSAASTHLLWIQWDSGVLNQNIWDPDFLNYDYIGAPFPCEPGTDYALVGYTPDRNVGSGGFSLRSQRLVNYLRYNADLYPLPDWQEDYALCHIYRPKLEAAGFLWAPTELATHFAFDTGPVVTTGSTFGYHGSVNWLWAFSREERRERINRASAFVHNNGRFREFLNYSERTPDLKPGTLIRFGLVYGAYMQF